MNNTRALYIKAARGNGKSMLQLEYLRKLFGISDEEWAEMEKKLEDPEYRKEVMRHG